MEEEKNERKEQFIETNERKEGRKEGRTKEKQTMKE